MLDVEGQPMEIEYGYRMVRDGTKFITKGKASEILHIIKSDTIPEHMLNTLIITEGVLDAIKVARFCQATPLWGSHMPLGLIRMASALFKDLGVWLDSDKVVEAVQTSLRASQYMNSFVISSVKDPKEYDINYIQEFIGMSMRKKLIIKEGEENT